jgi:hypothetical protein
MAKNFKGFKKKEIGYFFNSEQDPPLHIMKEFILYIEKNKHVEECISA